MSNIHRLNENNDNQNAPNPQNRRNLSMFGQNLNSNSINPREETFCSFLKNFCCPFLKFASFIAVITLLDITMYIITILYGGIDDVDNGFLAPTISTLDRFGMSVDNIY